MAAQSLAGKVAIVSGSSKGIGAATCVELASRQVFDLPRARNNKDERLLTVLRGAIVVVNYPWPSERQEAEAVLARICKTKSSSASKCILVESDLSTTTGPQHLVEGTIRQLGPTIDILVNNAGVAIMKALAEATLEQWDTMVNLNAPVLPYLSNPSRIVNLSSVGARQGYERSSIYCGTKSMIESFTRCWAIELSRKYGCTVNAICPGPTDTSAFNNSSAEFLAKVQPLLDATPAGSRMGTPEEVAHVIGFLCEEKSRWISGVGLGTNGGYFMA
ncbi:short chain type dehydrogenase [Hyaloscypha hepaticicola]|uniref:Short chain type dehydrogenase n=1 Tax=Hyaloscypha hepaticicola TaxID=2082293 RepID=A0A2J6PHK2_9HELO|nr:short chain type dehydrogenase [Hyaloscypha hepaticicola]